MRIFIFCLAGLALSAALASSGQARAEAPPSTAEQTKTAEAHFERGVELFEEGDFKLALVEFQRSHELVPNYRVLYNIGRVHYQLNNYALSLRTLKQYLEDGGPRIPPNRRAEVERDIASLKIRTAHVIVHADVEGADVFVDNERIGRSPLPDSELVDAGRHKVSASKLGYVTATETVTLVGGDEKAIQLHLVPVPKEKTLVEVRESNSLGPIWIGWALTVATAGGTIGTGIVWKTSDDKLTEMKKSQSSSSERASQASQVDTMRTVTLVLGGATLVSAAVSLYFTLTRKAEFTTSSSKVAGHDALPGLPISFGIGPGGAGVAAVF